MNLIALIALLASPAVSTGIWNLELNQDQTKTLNSFQPEGQTAAAYWEERVLGRVTELTYVCRAQDLCFSVPSSATLRFLDGRLAEVFLKIEVERAPTGVKPLERVRSELARGQFNRADAKTQKVGRLTRYFLRKNYTVVWIQDGPDSEVKLHFDATSPVSRAEAVAAGAQASLKRIAGAEAYAAGHRAVDKAQWTAAIEQFEQVVARSDISPLLKEPTRFVLAMALAARAQSFIKAVPPSSTNRDKALFDLDRARKMAPSLAPHLDKLRREAGRM